MLCWLFLLVGSTSILIVFDCNINLNSLCIMCIQDAFCLLNLWTRDHLGSYAKDHPAQFILGYCSTYIFMQTFMIPGTVFLSLLAGALFGVVRGLTLVVFNATAGATACFFLSNLIGRPLVSWMWPEKLKLFQSEVRPRHSILCFFYSTSSCQVIFTSLITCGVSDSKAKREAA